MSVYMKMILYLIPLIFLMVLCILSRKQMLPSEWKETGIWRILLKMSSYLYEKIRRKSKLLQRADIRKNLYTMYPQIKTESAESSYYIHKIGIVMLLMIAGSLIAGVLYLSSLTQNAVIRNSKVERNDYGQDSSSITLDAKNEEGDEIGEFELNIAARQYSKKEADKLFKKASDQLVKQILQDNLSQDEVRTDLYLPDKMDNFPFRISWKLDNYESIHADGKIVKDHEVSMQGENVTLTATFSYASNKWEQIIYIRVLPPVVDEKTKIYQEVKKMLSENENKTLENNELSLPQSVRNKKIWWHEHTQDTSFLFFFMIILSAIIIFFAKDRELDKEIQEREEELLLCYPQFVSQIVLYMGAGMTVRNILIKLAVEYVKEKNKGGKKRYLYEELCRVRYELEDGVAETGAIEHFGQRCRMQQYTRLCSLLTQNIRKGSSELLLILKEEALKATTERLDQARKKGEQAGTKLLIPMMMMLAVVMILIMIPAYRSF